MTRDKPLSNATLNRKIGKIGIVTARGRSVSCYLFRRFRDFGGVCNSRAAAQQPSKKEAHCLILAAQHLLDKPLLVVAFKLFQLFAATRQRIVYKFHTFV